jgi:hypothetical protein
MRVPMPNRLTPILRSTIPILALLVLTGAGTGLAAQSALSQLGLTEAAAREFV